MAKYRTLDQHVLCNGRLIEPGTEVEVPEDDVPTWEELVRLKSAERLTAPDEEIDESSDEGTEIEEDVQPAPPGAVPPGA